MSRKIIDVVSIENGKKGKAVAYDSPVTNDDEIIKFVTFNGVCNVVDGYYNGIRKFEFVYDRKRYTLYEGDYLIKYQDGTIVVISGKDFNNFYKVIDNNATPRVMKNKIFTDEEKARLFDRAKETSTLSTPKENDIENTFDKFAKNLEQNKINKIIETYDEVFSRNMRIHNKIMNVIRNVIEKEIVNKIEDKVYYNMKTNNNTVGCFNTALRELIETKELGSMNDLLKDIIYCINE